jgi:hypothetical protein
MIVRSNCRMGEETSTVQDLVHQISIQAGTEKQTPRAARLQSGKTYHMDSLPLFLEADNEISRLENLYAANVWNLGCNNACVQLKFSSLVHGF